MNRTMKDSGIPWIGEIPKGWKPCRFKNFVQLQTSPAVSDRKIGLENIESETGKYIETDSKFEGSGVQFCQGDIVYGKLRPYLRKVWLATFEGNAVGDFFVFRAKTEANPNYVKWLFLSDGYTEAANSSVYGAKMPRVSSDFILTLSYYLPSLSEQRRIADFLDRKCAEIDDAVALQEEFIAELKAYKQSVITEAVTRGLNPNAKLKPSGIDWIGEIPEGWEMTRIKNISSNYKAGPFGSALITGNLLHEGNILVYTPEHVADSSKIFDNSNNLYLQEERRNEMSNFFVKPGDIVFPIVGSLGRAIVIEENMPEGIINQRLSKFSIERKRVNETFFMWIFGKSEFYAKYIEMNCRGSFIVNLTKVIVGDMPLPIPPMEEQLAIADYLEKKCAEIDALVAIKQQKIEELKEYKKSIIYEYVTGKKEVQSSKAHRTHIKPKHT